MDSVAELDQAITGEFETFSRPGLRIHGRSLRYLGFQLIAQRRAASKTSPALGSWCAHIRQIRWCRPSTSARRMRARRTIPTAVSELAVCRNPKRPSPQSDKQRSADQLNAANSGKSGDGTQGSWLRRSTKVATRGTGSGHHNPGAWRPRRLPTRKTRTEACYTPASRADDRGVSVCVNLCNKVEARWVSHSRSASLDLLPSGQRAG